MATFRHSEGLKLLAGLDEPRLRQVISVVQTELPCSRNRLQKKLADLDVDTEKLTETLGYFLQRCIPGGPFHGRVWDEISSRLTAEELAAATEKKELFTQLFTPESGIAFKGALLQQRILPHVAEFDTFVDLRPVFDHKHTTILGYVPSVILQISLHSDNCDQVDVRNFQLAPAALEDMAEVLADAKVKLNVLTKSATSAGIKVL